MKAVLIVNENGQMSACPTLDQFERDEFITERMVVFSIDVSELVLFALKLAKQSVWLTGEGLPKPDPQPGRTYLVVYQGRLWQMKKGV